MKEKYFKKFNECAPATSLRKIGAFTIDSIIIFILSLLLTIFAAIPILKNNENFKTANNNLYARVSEIYDLQVDAKLSIKIDDKTLYSSNRLFETYFYSHLALSYDKNNREQKNEAKRIIIERIKKRSNTWCECNCDESSSNIFFIDL